MLYLRNSDILAHLHLTNKDEKKLIFDKDRLILVFSLAFSLTTESNIFVYIYIYVF